MKKPKGPRVLLMDIETKPLLGFVWQIWEQNIALNQIHTDWSVLSWSAKWLHDPPSKMMYEDLRKSKNIDDDKQLLQGIWKLLNEADVVVTQNGNSFDIKKLNARFILNGMQPPSSYKRIDTKLLAKKHFAFTSNKLEYMTDKICKKYKKLKHTKFPGFEMWTECMKGNQAAWKEMERYNKYDVLSLEELYKAMIPWDNTINFDLYSDSTEITCKCGSHKFHPRGYAYTATGKFQKWRCDECGSETRGRENLFSKEKKKSLRVGTVR
jgi:RNase_H superfamily